MTETAVIAFTIIVNATTAVSFIWKQTPRVPFTSYLFSSVTRVGVTRGGNWWCHPYIFSWKKWRPFSGHRHLQSDEIFRPRFFPTFFVLSGCHPLEGVTRGGPPLVTPLFVCFTVRYIRKQKFVTSYRIHASNGTNTDCYSYGLTTAVWVLLSTGSEEVDASRERNISRRSSSHKNVADQRNRRRRQWQLTLLNAISVVRSSADRKPPAAISSVCRSDTITRSSLDIWGLMEKMHMLSNAEYSRHFLQHWWHWSRAPARREPSLVPSVCCTYALYDSLKAPRPTGDRRDRLNRCGAFLYARASRYRPIQNIAFVDVLGDGTARYGVALGVTIRSSMASESLLNGHGSQASPGQVRSGEVL